MTQHCISQQTGDDGGDARVEKTNSSGKSNQGDIPDVVTPRTTQQNLTSENIWSVFGCKLKLPAVFSLRHTRKLWDWKYIKKMQIKDKITSGL